MRDLSHPWIAAILGSLLLLLAGGSAWLAVELHDPDTDPHWSAVGTALLFAGLFCILALVAVVRAALRRRGWIGASLWMLAGLFSLIVLLAVAMATRLGG